MKRFVIGGKKCAVLRTMNEWMKHRIHEKTKQKWRRDTEEKDSNFGSVQLNDIHLKTATANIHCVHWSHFEAAKCWKDTILLLRGEKTTKTKKKYYFLTIVEIVGLNFLWPISAKRALSFKIVRGISICVCLWRDCQQNK